VGIRQSAETFRRIACDAGLVPMRHGPTGETIDVGRRTRTIPPALRRALEARDHGCQFPGCTNHLYVHAHHIQHWAHGGATSPENLVLLCSAHHRMVHEGGFRVSRSEGIVQFHDPHGRQLERSPAPATVERGWQGVREWTKSRIDADTNLPGWDGTPIEYDATLSALWECR